MTDSFRLFFTLVAVLVILAFLFLSGPDDNDPTAPSGALAFSGFPATPLADAEARFRVEFQYDLPFGVLTGDYRLPEPVKEAPRYADTEFVQRVRDFGVGSKGVLR